MITPKSVSHRLLPVRLCLFAIFLASAGWASEVSVDADWLHRGWVSTSSWGYSYYQAGFDANDYEYRNWFEFTLPDWSSAPTAAALYLNTLTADTSKIWEIHGVSTALSDYWNTFNNIGLGATYGSFDYNDPADEHQLATIPLNAAALDAIILGGPGGTFRMGGLVTTHTTPGAYEEIFYGVPPDGYKAQLLLTFDEGGSVPEPSTVALVFAGIAIAVFKRRRVSA